MRLPESFFNKFIMIVAAATVAYMIYVSFSYRNGQVADFEKLIRTEFDRVNEPVYHLTKEDSVILADDIGSEFVILFTAAWSDRAIDLMNDRTFQKWISSHNPVIALVKDDPELMNQQRDTTIYPYMINGTDWYQTWNVPGIPSIIWVQNKKLNEIAVGEDAIRELFE
jgi:hypothetical protein